LLAPEEQLNSDDTNLNIKRKCSNPIWLNPIFKSKKKQRENEQESAKNRPGVFRPIKDIYEAQIYIIRIYAI